MIRRKLPSLTRGYTLPRSSEISTVRTYSAQGTTPPSEHELDIARKFLATFSKDTIPRRICEVGYSRSSGPGGQNVNKVNSKATLKVSLKDLLALIPSALHARIRESPYVTGRGEAIVISSDDQRKQIANTETCFAKLSDLIKDAGAKSIPGQTSAETRERVTLL